MYGSEAVEGRLEDVVGQEGGRVNGNVVGRLVVRDDCKKECWQVGKSLGGGRWDAVMKSGC